MSKPKTIVDIVSSSEIYAAVTLDLAKNKILDAVEDYRKYDYQIVVIAVPKRKGRVLE